MIVVTLVAVSPLHHGAFSDIDTGNVTAFRRIAIALPDGRHVSVPHVSGSALRGQVRRILMRGLLDACGVTPESAGARPYQRLYAALANGGHLEGSEASVDPARISALRAALPPLSALGAALYTWQLAGRVEVGALWPVAQETALGGQVSDPGGALRPVEDMVVEYSHTRHVDRDEHDPATSGVTPMPVTIEVLIPGTMLEARISTRRATDIEASALAWALEHIEAVGAKSGSGLGRVRVQVEGASGDLYAAWLGEHRDVTRAALLALAADLGSERKPKGKSKGAATPDAA